MFRHETRNTTFVLVVDDFGVKFDTEADWRHLVNTLELHYKLKTDKDGKKFLGITIQFDRSLRTCTLSMPGYVEKALARFEFIWNKKPTHSPLKFTPPVYGVKGPQYTSNGEESPETDPATIQHLRQVVGTFLYYAACVDISMQHAIGHLSVQQSSPPVSINQQIHLFLSYAATWPDAHLVYHASDMKLVAYSDASHHSETKSRSRSGGTFHLGNADDDYNSDFPLNGLVLATSAIIPTVPGSVSESEYASMFLNGCHAEVIRNTLADLGYPQNATPMIVDNSTAEGIANDSVKEKKSKFFYTKYHWIRDRVRLKHFLILWKPGKSNIADYFTKVHPPFHFRHMRSYFVSDPKNTQVHDNARSRRKARKGATCPQPPLYNVPINID